MLCCLAVLSSIPAPDWLAAMKKDLGSCPYDPFFLFLPKAEKP
ncbi:hypothetical protein SACS_0704 [Parasaccharibacter apium]|uniref:Uncharacterized protein n=1 Tax=Parasaccharibacter apium TaxID=1510841 RepID=A0A7U7J0V2_9PROT|nr:hypothetical protein SACS_0704 [Parasaccharibacter apium]